MFTCCRCSLFAPAWRLTKWHGPEPVEKGTSLSGSYCRACYNWLNTRANFVEYVTLKAVTARLTS